MLSRRLRMALRLVLGSLLPGVLREAVRGMLPMRLPETVPKALPDIVPEANQKMAVRTGRGMNQEPLFCQASARQISTQRFVPKGGEELNSEVELQGRTL